MDETENQQSWLDSGSATGQKLNEIVETLGHTYTKPLPKSGKS